MLLLICCQGSSCTMPKLCPYRVSVHAAACILRFITICLSTNPGKAKPITCWSSCSRLAFLHFYVHCQNWIYMQCLPVLNSCTESYFSCICCCSCMCTLTFCPQSFAFNPLPSTVPFTVPYTVLPFTAPFAVPFTTPFNAPFPVPFTVPFTVPLLCPALCPLLCPSLCPLLCPYNAGP